MAKTRQKKPTTKPTTSASSSPQRLKLLEEFVSLDREVANFKPMLFRHEKLRRLILDWYPALGPDDEEKISVGSFDILISSRDRIRSVTLKGKKALFALWGPRDFIAKAIVLLKTLPDPEDKGGLYTEQASTGPRHVKVIERHQASAA